MIFERRVARQTDASIWRCPAVQELREPADEAEQAERQRELGRRPEFNLV